MLGGLASACGLGQPGLGDFEITFVSTNGAGALELVNADGTNRRLVPTGDDRVGAPTWSPDGTRIAYISEHRLPNGESDTDVYVIERANGQPVRVGGSDIADRWPSWSPDSKQVAYTTWRDEMQGDIWIAAADASDDRRLTTGSGLDTSPAWSPDGSTIAFVSNRDENIEIYAASANGGEDTNLTQNPASDNAPVWSPDGTRIAFLSDRSTTQFRDVWIMDGDGGNPTNISGALTDDDAPVWSPSSDRLAWMSLRDGNWEIYSAEVPGGEPKRLTEHGDQDRYPSFSPDGKWIAFLSNRDDPERFDLWVMQSDGQEPRAVTEDVATWQPAWRPRR